MWLGADEILDPEALTARRPFDLLDLGGALIRRGAVSGLRSLELISAQYRSEG
jgi:hypothetical protein